jgi:Lamin Tail Domain
MRHVPLALVVRGALGTSLLALACSGATLGDSDATTTTVGDSTTAMGDETAAACGDGVAEGTEACDGEDLGGQTCTDLPGLAGGTLACTTACTLDTTGCTIDPTMAVVRFNEVVSADVTAGPFMGATDAIELYNLGGAAADLSGWRLSDDPGLSDDKTYVFPDGTSLAPGELQVLVQLDDATGMGDYPFGISNSDSETLTLVDAADATVDTVSFAGPDATSSWCRIPDGDGEWQACTQTLGERNATDVMGVVLNELTAAGADEIEIYNFGRTSVDLSAYILTDDLADPDGTYDFDADLEKLVLPPLTVLDPGERLVVSQGTDPGEHLFGLDPTGDAIGLLTPGLVVIDFVAYGDGEADDAYCRLPDGPRGEWTAGCTPSFGDPNTP